MSCIFHKIFKYIRNLKDEQSNILTATIAVRKRRTMKIISYFYKFIFILICISPITGCSKDAADKLNDSIELYSHEDTTKAKIRIEDSLINSALIRKFKGHIFSYGENIIFYRQKKTLYFAYPQEFDIEINENYNLISYDPEPDQLGLSNGYDIKIYTSKGKLIKTCGPAPDDKSIKSFTISNNNIYYYKDKKIYAYDLVSDDVKLLANDKSANAFNKEAYNVKFYKTENLLGIVTGIAGKYYLNVLDLNNNLMILTDLNMASSKLYFQNNELFLIRGSAGKYLLARLSLPSKKIQNLFEFKNLTDIEFFAAGLLFEDNDGLKLIEYGKPYNYKIPFRYGLSGQCGGRPVIIYLDEYYIIDPAVFLEKITLINNRIPSLFEETVKK